MTEQVNEARMSAAVKLQRAFEREQQKSAASRRRGEELLKKARESQQKKQEQVNEVATGNPGGGYHGSHQTADDKYEEIHAHVKNLTDADDKTVKHYLDSGHGTKLAGKEEDHAYIKKDFDKFMKYYRPKVYDQKEKIQEVLTKDTPASEVIKDFIDSDNPKFAGKSKEKRKQMALAAYYAKQRNEEVDESYFGPRGDKLIAHSHAAFKSGDKEKSSRAHKLAMKAGEKYRSNPENNAKAIAHIMSGASQDYKDQEKKRGIGHVRDHVELEGDTIQEGTIQPSGTDKVEVAGNTVPANNPKGKTVKSFKFFTSESVDESFTFDSAAMAKQELADVKNKKKRGRGKVANLLRKLGMKEEVEQIDEVNHREYATQGKVHPDMAKHMSVGQETDFYHPSNGDKVSGVVKHKSNKEVHIKAHKDGKVGAGDMHKFNISEELQQIDEISKDTAKSYVVKKMDKIATTAADSSDKVKKNIDAMQGAHQRIVGAKPTSPKKLKEFIETLKEGKAVDVNKVNAAGQEPHEEEWKDVKKKEVKKESYTVDQLLIALKEGMWPGTPEYNAKFGGAKQGGGAGIKKGSRYGGSLQKDEPDHDEDDEPKKAGRKVGSKSGARSTGTSKLINK